MIQEVEPAWSSLVIYVELKIIYVELKTLPWLYPVVTVS